MVPTKPEIKRIVVWGLKKRWHTHRFIHKAFYENAKKLGYDTVWIEDEKKNQNLIEPGDLIIAAEAVGKMVPEKNKFEDYNLPVRDDIFYCLHSFKKVFSDKIKTKNLVTLNVYRTGEAEKSDQKWGPATYFNTKTRTLYQPWGTNLLPNEFKKPIFNKNKIMFWIGSIWNDKYNAGNINEINELKKAARARKLFFIQVRFIPDWLNIFLTRLSRLSPAIAGKSQVDSNYLPCRMFKNISYGQLGITNVKKFKDILGENFIQGDSIVELVNSGLDLTKDEYLTKVRAQQEIIKNYTYKNSIENIIKALNQ